jgi:hypothetical protein
MHLLTGRRGAPRTAGISRRPRTSARVRTTCPERSEGPASTMALDNTAPIQPSAISLTPALDRLRKSREWR